ncbi:SulP family inorganic anion transporter [Cohnella lubricantis]|uniref:SulP family inorganic anion transporter n=1 Tax=Cohnella lubricantis TaxID=2163172 RepID=A0A841TIS8_9BACL|nr:SulP family inorganic anion transporter [Cohnella lubricantis]MBB6679120.1 SulP family inorganic anion transporter [Cohnella lubricantis]MBP2120187.1 SulP family sulfate permease [Cohnella lubricantis]
MYAKLKNAWFFNVRKDILSGMTVALALIPEAIAFSILAGVDPMVGLYASFCIAVTISLVGGRMGMISAATGAMASLMGPIIAKYGIEYLFAASILTGILQYVMGLLKFGKLFTFIPHSVVTGFVNALAILIFMAQLTNFEGANWIMYLMVAGTLAVIYLFPLLTKAVPSALVAIIIMTALSMLLHLDLRTVGDMGEIKQALPFFHLPDIELSLHAVWTILPFSLALAVVGITESMMTASLVDELTETKSDKNKEIRGQGIANVVSGLFGGMAGCAMIGQTMINVKSGGRSRLSTFVSGVFLLFLILVLGDVVKQIPMAALVGVMFMVSIGTFDWNSLRTLVKVPRGDAFVMIVTVVLVVITSDLAIGVVTGVVLSALLYGWKSARVHAHASVSEGGVKTYRITGQMFFGTMTRFADLFDYKGDPDRVVIDFSATHLWDHSAVTAIAKAVAKYEQNGKRATIAGLNEESQALVDRSGLAVPAGH